MSRLHPCQHPKTWVQTLDKHKWCSKCGALKFLIGEGKRIHWKSPENLVLHASGKPGPFRVLKVRTGTYQKRGPYVTKSTH